MNKKQPVKNAESGDAGPGAKKIKLLVKDVEKLASRLEKQGPQIIDWRLLKPSHDLPLTAKRGNTLTFTHSGLLKQARALNDPQHKEQNIVSASRLQLDSALHRSGRGVAIDGLLPLAANLIEEKMFRLFHQFKPGLFATFTDPLKALLHLRVLHVPMICREFLDSEFERNENNMLWLGALMANVVAYKRTLLERLFRAAYKSGILLDSAEKMEEWARRELGDSIFNWFDKTEEGLPYWLSRFDQWFCFAMRSVDSYYRLQSSDYRTRKGEFKEAVQLGILKLLDALPLDRFPGLLEGVNDREELRKMFKKNAKKRRTNQHLLEFRSWLIECWPLVLEYGWTYRDVQRVANIKFEEFEGGTKKLPINKIKDLKKFCKKLGLKISPSASCNVGRPAQNGEQFLPSMAEVALRIDGLQDSEWYV